jgi:hypothetical protein
VVTERSGWRSVGDGCDERLLIGLSSAEAIEADLLLGKIDLDADETVWPEGINQESAQEDLDGALFVSAAQEDDGSLERPLEIEVPVLRKGMTWGSGLDAWCGPRACGLHKAIRPLPEVVEVFVFKAPPDLGLPAAVVALNRGLEAGLFMGCEDRDDTQLQAESCDAAEGVAIDPIPLEDGVIVELGIVWQAVLAPVIKERFDRESGPPERSHPAPAETSMQADAVEDHDVGAPADDEAFHEIETVEFRLPSGDARQVPALRRRGTTNSCPSIESTAPQEDPTDGAGGGDPLDSPLPKFVMNGSSAEFAKVAEQLEMPSDAEDQVLDAFRGCPGGPSSTTWCIREVDAVKSLSARPSHPFLNCCQSHAKLPRHRSQRSSALNCSHHPLPQKFNTLLFESRFGPCFSGVFRSILTTIDCHSSDHL